VVRAHIREEPVHSMLRPQTLVSRFESNKEKGEVVYPHLQTHPRRAPSVLSARERDAFETLRIATHIWTLSTLERDAFETLHIATHTYLTRTVLPTSA